MAIPAESMGAVKKGPWTPEEDLILVSHVQQHGPHNWDSVPKNAGLRRCGKSCRLRWSNYLRPGIKLGNFSRDEEKTIVNLQAVLGNKWSVIAAHLPQRTDNDIKNYWNSHLKKKLQRQKKRNDEQVPTGGSATTSASSDSSSSGRPRRGIWETRLQNDVQMARQALSQALDSSPAASSTATPATATATVTPAAILPQGVQFSAQLMATPLLPSSAVGFMGGFKPPSNESNRFTNPITSDHQLSTGPAQIQGSPSHHVFPADNMARLLQNMTKLPAPAAAFEEAISPDSVPSNVDSLSHPTIPDPLDAIVGLNYGKSNDNSSNLFDFYSTDTATFPDVMILEHQNFQVNASIKSTVVTNSSIPAPVNTTSSLE